MSGTLLAGLGLLDIPAKGIHDQQEGGHVGWGTIFKWLSAQAAVAVIVGLLWAVPSTAGADLPARAAAFGDWTVPVKISNEEMIFGDVSEYGIYHYGWNNMTYSKDWGGSWAPEVPMGGRIEIVGSTIYRVNVTDYYSGNVWFCKSTDNGSTWSTPVDLGIPATNDGYYGTFLLNGTLLVYDYDSSMTQIVVVKSVDLGDSWSAAVKVTDVSWDDPLPNDLVFFKNRLYLAYWNWTFMPPFTFSYEVVLIESSDMGDTWGDRLLMGTGLLPLLKEDGGELYMTYYTNDSMLNFFVAFTKSADGDSWSAPLNVGNLVELSDSSWGHALSVSSGAIVVAYPQYISGPPEDYLLSINFSGDDGFSWQDLGDVTGTGTHVMLPSVWIIGNTLHFFFVDMGTDDWTGDPFPTLYRAMDLTGGIIPEFGSLTAVIAGTVAVLIGVAYLRRREHSST